jgi:predicted TIM-barrel fold metal-dependent hydrolase
MTVVDVWTQPLIGRRPNRLEVPEGARVFRRSGSKATHDTRVDPDELIALMDEGGVESVLLCAWHRAGGWVISNDDVAEYTRAHPERLFGVASVDLADPVGAVNELRRAVDELGFDVERIVETIVRRTSRSSGATSAIPGPTK